MRKLGSFKVHFGYVALSRNVCILTWSGLLESLLVVYEASQKKKKAPNKYCYLIKLLRNGKSPLYLSLTLKLSGTGILARIKALVLDCKVRMCVKCSMESHFNPSLAATC